MTLDKVKSFIKDNQNKDISFKFNGYRNQTEEFKGTIVNAYNAVFLVKINDNNVLRSFSYADVLIGNLEVEVMNV